MEGFTPTIFEKWYVGAERLPYDGEDEGLEAEFIFFIAWKGLDQVGAQSEASEKRRGEDYECFKTREDAERFLRTAGPRSA